jgi:hypothetical protein
MTRASSRIILSALLVCVTAVVSLAQTTTTTTETKKFEVIAVDGNTLVVRLPEGTREITVAPDFRFNVDGKDLTVSQLRPGMAGTATITTKTTMVPVTVTEVKSGTVRSVTGSTIIVSTPEGYRMFSQDDVNKRAVRIMREGKRANISDFRPNDQLTAIFITDRPPQTLTEQQVQATLARGGAPAASTTTGGGAAAGGAGRGAAPAGAAGAPPAQTASSGAPARQLPATASPLPLVGLMGLASLVMGLGLTVRRRRSSR